MSPVIPQTKAEEEELAAEIEVTMDELVLNLCISDEPPCPRESLRRLFQRYEARMDGGAE